MEQDCFGALYSVKINPNKVGSLQLVINLRKKKLRGLSPRANPTDRNLSATLVQTFVDRGMSPSQRGGSPTAVISVTAPK
jgi:hypothetical protein